MQWEEWNFSMKLAWQDFFFRWTILVAFTSFLAGSVFLLVNLIPIGWRTGILSLHYNVYLGIDDVRGWPYVFWLPVLMWLCLVTDVLAAGGMFRRDIVAARTLLGVGLIAILLWCAWVFFLVRVNG